MSTQIFVTYLLKISSNQSSFSQNLVFSSILNSPMKLPPA